MNCRLHSAESRRDATRPQERQALPQTRASTLHCPSDEILADIKRCCEFPFLIEFLASF